MNVSVLLYKAHIGYSSDVVASANELIRKHTVLSRLKQRQKVNTRPLLNRPSKKKGLIPAAVNAVLHDFFIWQHHGGQFRPSRSGRFLSTCTVMTRPKTSPKIAHHAPVDSKGVTITLPVTAQQYHLDTLHPQRAQSPGV